MDTQSALHACDNALNKFPGHESIQALKAIAMQRLDRCSEAVAICDELLSRPKLKEETMFHLELALKGMGKHDKVAKLYEKAYERNPKDPELQRKLFSSYASNGDTVRQQQMALKLYKASGGKSEKFLFWAVASLVMQYESTHQEQFLLIAKTMVEKHAAHGGLLMADSLVLFIEILSKLRMWDAALEHLKEHGKRLMKMENERTLLEIHLLEAGGKLDLAKESLEAYLTTSPDDWNALLKLTDIVFLLLARGTQNQHLGTKVNGQLHVDNEESTSEDLVCQLTRFLHALNEGTKVCAGHVARGPQLALCELKKRMILHGMEYKDDNVANIFPELVDGICDYWIRFGHLASCSLDLSSYCRMLEPPLAIVLQEKMTKALSLMEGLSRLEALRFETSLVQIEYLCGYVVNLEPEGIMSWARQVMLKHEEATTIIGPRDPREFDFADQLPGLAAASLVHCCRKFNTKNSMVDVFACLVAALVDLQVGVRRAPYNAEMQLALCGLYGILSCLREAEKAFTKLEIKHVQYESVASHHLLPMLTSSCSTSTATAHLDRLIEFHSGQVQNVGDSISLAMEHGNFSKAIEFWKFSERLKASFSLAAAESERARIQTRKAIESMLANGRYELDLGHRCIFQGNKTAFRFNDDLQTRPDWLPPPSSWRFAKAELWDHLGNPKANWSWWEDIESLDPRSLRHREALVHELYKSQLAHASILRTCFVLPADTPEPIENAPSAELQALGLQGDVQDSHDIGADSWSDVTLALEQITLQTCRLADVLFSRQEESIGAINEISKILIRSIRCVFTFIMNALPDVVGVFSRVLSVGPSFFNDEVLYLIAVLDKCTRLNRQGKHTTYNVCQSCDGLVATLKSYLQELTEQLKQEHAARKEAGKEIVSLVREKIHKSCTSFSLANFESVVKSIIDEKNAAMDELRHTVELRLRQLSKLAALHC